MGLFVMTTYDGLSRHFFGWSTNLQGGLGVSFILSIFGYIVSITSWIFSRHRVIAQIAHVVSCDVLCLCVTLARLHRAMPPYHL
jgi:hypothetical protein